MSDKSRKQVLEEAREQAAEELNEELANERLALLKRLDEIEEIHVDDNAATSLRKIVKHYADGISMSRLSFVFADPSALIKARKALSAEIEEIKVGRSIILKPKAA
jgi:hypothetical protein